MSNTVHRFSQGQKRCTHFTLGPKTQIAATLELHLRFLFVTGLPVRPSHKMGFRSSAAKNGLPGEGRHEGLVPRNDVLTNVFIWFSLARTLARILFVPRLRSPWKTHKALRTWRRLFALFEAIRSWESLYIFYCSSLSQLDDVGAGKLREMLALHSNRHAVHGRFTLKDECGRQVWNAVAASLTQRENYLSM